MFYPKDINFKGKSKGKGKSKYSNLKNDTLIIDKISNLDIIKGDIISVQKSIENSIIVQQ